MYVYCVQDWSMLPEFFPSGLSGLYDKLKVPFLYYMPYWCMDNNTARTDRWQFVTQVIPPLPSLSTLLRPYLAHFCPVFLVFSRFSPS